MKKWYHLLTFIIIFALLTVSCGQLSVAASYWYQPDDVTLGNNIYNITEYPSFQWYYLDAMLNDNYSIHIGMVTIGCKATYGFFLFRINIYHQSEILEKKYKLVPLRQLSFSQQEPGITLGDEHILKGSVNNQGQLVTNITMSIDNVAVNLTFIGQTQGWIGHTGKGIWGCPLPKAHVQGTLVIDEENIDVSGVGYQEHGWDIQRLHRSWYWGKFSTNTTNVIFSQNMKNRREEDTFIVMVNHGEDNYTSIKRENIEFSHDKYTVSYGRLIPTQSILRIYQDDISVDVTIEIDHIHFTTLLLMSHWRFHADVTGEIIINNHKELVNGYQIMELFRFP